ncbi:glycosyltransferase [Saccharibacillus brassicae]|uniref:glycosyltransferase n=1 Tax=Saccharibacillus brassicae TaxID=2583377 RepID=UPI002482C06E|nr:glycosyltransferase [Saccharibacillus brassicae]
MEAWRIANYDERRRQRKLKPLVSVIVPVFNVEHYLGRCLDSLLAQTLENIEIIVIDDGSTDGSPAVAREYEKRDERIQVIRQENRGLSGARNTGLDAASGEFVGFVDSDDWILPKTFETMYRSAQKHEADLCACDYTLAYEDGRLEHGVLGLRSEKLELPLFGLDKFWNDKRYSVVVWNKIYRRSIIQSQALRFESNRRVFSEDVLFNLCFLKHAGVCSAVSESFYCYFQRGDSLMNSPKPDYLKRELFLVDRFSDYYADYANSNVYQALLSRLFFERVQNSCLHNLSSGMKIRVIHKELKQAGTHPLFEKSMTKEGSDRGLWLPMRVFAMLCGKKRYRAAAWYLRLFLGLSNVKKKWSGRQKVNALGVTQAKIV